MIVKTYSAESATAALKQIRAELGGDAVILKTTKGTSQNGRPAVYVTACAEAANESAFPNRLAQSETLNQPQETVVFPRRVASKNETEQPGASPAATAPNTTTSNTIQAQGNGPQAAQRGFQLLSQIDQKLDKLLARPVQTSESTTTRIEKNSAVDSNESPLTSRPTTDETLRALLQHGYALDVAERLQMKCGDRLSSGVSISTCEEEILAGQVQELNFSRGEAVVVIGLPGSGKSSVIATLAQKITFGARLPIRLSSLDATRIAATDELATYAELLGTDILTTQQIGSYTDGVALIDTPGISGEHSVATIASQLKEITNKKVILAILSTLSMSALRALIKKTQPLAPAGIIFTMSDQSSPLPLAVALSLECELPIYGRIETGNGASDLHSLFVNAEGGVR
jgi:flagellar biosynthesis GTPase FlhF